MSCKINQRRQGLHWSQCQFQRVLNVLLIVIFPFLFVLLARAEYCYEEDEPCGQWPGVCSSGYAQSPLSLNLLSSTIRKCLPPTFYNTNSRLSSFDLINNGRQITFSMDFQGAEKPLLTSSELPGTYAFSQGMFHWGSRRGLGSEHKINGQTFGMELQLIHHSVKYSSEESAIESGDRAGLAIVSVLFQIGERDNDGLNPIVRALPSVFTRGRVTVDEEFNLADILPPEGQRDFFRYNGSMTTPDCSEVVQWIVLKHPVSVSQSQIETFRRVQGVRTCSNPGTNECIARRRNGTVVLLPTTGPSPTPTGPSPLGHKIKKIVAVGEGKGLSSSWKGSSTTGAGGTLTSPSSRLIQTYQTDDLDCYNECYRPAWNNCRPPQHHHGRPIVVCKEVSLPIMLSPLLIALKAIPLLLAGLLALALAFLLFTLLEILVGLATLGIFLKALLTSPLLLAFVKGLKEKSPGYAYGGHGGYGYGS